jgi:hypothetical protein
LIVAGLGLGLTPPQRIAVVPPAAPAVAPPIPAVPPLPPQPVVAVVLHPGDYYVRNAAGINVRATPSKAGTETGKLCYGSKVHVDRTAPSETDPGFVYAWVKTPKVQGWAFTGEQGDWFAPTQPIEAKKLPAGKTCRLNRDVNLRKQPNKDGQLVTKLAKSGSVKIENRVQSTSDPCGHFYRVRTPDGKSGYAYFGPTDDWVDCN